MIARIWHGWTSAADAGAYERLLREEIFTTIEAKQVAGFRRIELLRRPAGAGEVEFVTIMLFDTLDDVKAFAGEDYEAAYVPARAREVLARFDQRSQHYEVAEQRVY